MANMELLTNDEFIKALDSKRGFVIIHQPLEQMQDDPIIHFMSCQDTNVQYRRMFSTDHKFNSNTIKLHHYDSFEEIDRDYPKARFINMRIFETME